MQLHFCNALSDSYLFGIPTYHASDEQKTTKVEKEKLKFMNEDLCSKGQGYVTIQSSEPTSKD